jgi:hypothetical protein
LKSESIQLEVSVNFEDTFNFSGAEPSEKAGTIQQRERSPRILASRNYYCDDDALASSGGALGEAACAILMISSWICSLVFPCVKIPSFLAASISSSSPVLFSTRETAGVSAEDMVVEPEEGLAAGCGRADLACGADVEAWAVSEGANRGLALSCKLVAAFWNSFVALSNSFLALATVLASSGIF